MAVVVGTDMSYNYTKHFYILDIEHVKNTLGIDFVESEGSLTKAKDKMLQISRTIYNYIYKHTHYKAQMEFWLATDSDIRPIILSVLEEQSRYEYDVNAEYLSKQSGLNVLNGVQININKFRGEARISPDAIDILRQNKLLYAGQRFFTVGLPSYETGGY